MATDLMAIRKKEYLVREDEARELLSAMIRLSAALGARLHLILHPILYLSLEEIKECEAALLAEDFARAREIMDEARTRYPEYQAEATAA